MTTRGWIDVPDVDALEPFLVSVVSPSDHWLYASSRGGLAAGRVSPEGSLFPYQTDDRLHRAQDDVGGWSCLHVERDGSSTTWEPWRPRRSPDITRRLRKSVAGDRLIYEELHTRLQMRFTVQWGFSKRFGLVRTVQVSNEGSAARVRVADGLNGLLPAGPPLALVQTSSCLVNAYTRSEWDARGSLALYALEALPSDRAEPAEALRANVAWSAGLDVQAVLLSRQQLDAFVLGEGVESEGLVTGRPGAFIVTSSFELAAGETRTWYVLTDVDRDHLEVEALRRRDTGAITDQIEAELDATTAELDGILADVDGLQRTADPVLDAHQRSSALFNAMRGGVPVREHRILGTAFDRFVAARNADCHARNADWLAGLRGQTLEVGELLDRVDATDDADLQRLAREKLPLWFGRRHGDPSRPWNAFAIRVEDGDDRRVYWQGNWRDIFQNWEALLLAYPQFLESVISVFVNASTLDGYNPYRITSDGVDWEQPEPENPWANLGYWGDHQVSYLTRLLELSDDHHPGRLQRLLQREIFSSADVPYRMRGHDALVAHPRDAITFDHAHQATVDEREKRVGSDGRRVHDAQGVLHLNLAEKLLLPVLAKLSALIPGAGIWMNTQRPEWNDANNALAGNGVSVVTAAYLRRHLAVLRELFASLGDEVRLTDASATWLDSVSSVLAAEPTAWTPTTRRPIIDALGHAAEAYRSQIYVAPPTSRTTRPSQTLVELCAHGLRWLDDALAHALRPDGLYDGYDLVAFGKGTATISRLYPMLEGQVAVLSSGALGPAQAADLVDTLYDSDLYRPDVHTFILYPNRSLPSYLAKNRIPEERAKAHPGVERLLQAGATEIVARDASGVLRFGPDLRNARDLSRALDGAGVTGDDAAGLLQLWEATFDHHAFTGRSGTMHAYEGLGSVYWHMVGKLLVAVQECWRDAADGGAEPAVVERLARAYHRVRDGLGFNRTPAEFGAIPTDPYSHTPASRGAQQPGMTGLVKEELLSRRQELGVQVDEGCLSFIPRLLEASEALPEATTWTLPAGVRPERSVDIPAGGQAFLVCGVPVVYAPADAPHVTVYTDEGTTRVDGSALDRATSERVFQRDPGLRRIEVGVVGR